MMQLFTSRNEEVCLGEAVAPKAEKPGRKQLALVAGLWLSCALNLHGQAAPGVTSPPANQTNLVGSAVTFSVVVTGPGPFTYHWQFNGTNLPITITTVAGGGSGGDGGAATNARIALPQNVAFDAAGNLYVTSASDDNIRKVDSNGIISAVAGNGTGGFSGDGGAATNASLNSPWGVAVDAVGNLYFADHFNQRIRKVDTSGVITTVAGNGATDGNGNPFYSGDGGAATNATLYYPNGIALDAAGNLYIADSYNNRIRKVDTNGIITTVAGDSVYQYSGDGGPATNASLNSPWGVALDSAGNLYIADYNNDYVRKVDTNGIITTVAGNGVLGYSGDGGAATNAGLDGPSAVAMDAAGNLYIADQYNYRIRKVDPNGIITTVAGKGQGYSGDGGAATNATLSQPCGVALDSTGNLYIADFDNWRVREVAFAGHPMLTLTNVSASNAGNYRVLVTSPYGSVTSAAAALTVVNPPAIVVVPASQRVLTGGNVTLSVSATGTPPLNYSWYFDATNLVQSGTNGSLILNNMSAGTSGQYTVVVSNPYASVTNPAVTVTTSSAAIPTHRYALDTDANDAIGGANGVLRGNARFANNALVLDGTNSSVLLPNDLFTNAGVLSVEVWFADTPVNNISAQLYNFSGALGAMKYMLTGREAYIVGSGSNTVSLASPAVGGTNHLVWTQDSFTNDARIYVNGRLAAENTNFTYTPLLIGSTTNNCIGGSGGATAAGYFKGRIIEFRTYQGAPLSPLNVACDYAQGPDQLPSDPGALQAIRLVVPPVGPGALFRAEVFADFANLSNVDISTQPDLVLTSDNSNAIIVVSNQLLRTASLGVANIAAAWQGLSNTEAVTVGVPQDVALLHRYSFNELTNDWILHDSMNGANGQVMGGYPYAMIGNGSLKMLGYPSSVAYGALPAGLISGLSEVSIEAWVTWTLGNSDLGYGYASWQRIFDFGSQFNGSGLSYLYLTPATDGSSFTTEPLLHAAITTNFNENETPRLNWKNILPTGVETFVALTYSPVRGIMKMYLNGVPVASGSAVLPLSGIVDTNCWLGRSQFSADPYFNGSYDEFRIYGGLLSDSDVAADYASGPNAVGVDYVLHYFPGTNSLALTWGPSAAALTLESSPALGIGAVWNPVSFVPALSNGRLRSTVPISTNAAFFRLHLE